MDKAITLLSTITLLKNYLNLFVPWLCAQRECYRVSTQLHRQGLVKSGKMIEVSVHQSSPPVQSTSPVQWL